MKSRLISLREPLKVAGFLCIVAPLQWIILVFVAQAYYPNYSITKNDLSDLGATCHNAVGPTPGVCTIYQPASIIWNVTLSLFGILTVVAAYFIYRGLKNRLFCTFLGLFGLGALIAGVVPENTNLTTHGLGALVSFVAGAVAAITVYRLRLASRLFNRFDHPGNHLHRRNHSPDICSICHLRKQRDRTWRRRAHHRLPIIYLGNDFSVRSC